MSQATELDFDSAELLQADSHYRWPSYADLKGKKVFITGGGSGIGAYFVTAFIAQGADVGFVSLSQDPANKLCDGVEQKYGRRPFYQACDIRDVDALKAAMAAFIEHHGAIDILINNAARDTRHDVESLQADQWDDAMNTNLRPHYFSAQAAVPGMRARGAGSVINVGSNSFNLGLGGYPAYVASKGGIVGLSRALATELGPDNIRVNALIPGWVMTKRQKELWVTPEALEECLAQQSIKDTISGEDIAEAALFLASSASRMITGQEIIVDGGRA
ncbi:SDR family NAD(P)-dependent oxidoreductase [Pseudoteredinibacter isoporae]|uniref:NAD(P)-dependent dehydrogenase (Short-subunit alcohol dehydrogenase family) n=1 Tax=Pseudoteredinibacter isoporae TaxID=570281 RepID=A0A7X0MWU3_9GAMM|nr:SDR family oxidoreductase [Pseudoteredinibacter isoporae]MBB6522570.1 NAD(P)-dependent dehydrogenase (short-subunit alcohol dehydrogenase family) [Pseudoteredinibacter isoporae]NHO88100.1 SDR family oxidoreductase [Pseudoteredinibacter isoporae]NIB23569.1 SDR family oxidoreductase [Pseudoteredinibacter isoporae]